MSISTEEELKKALVGRLNIFRAKGKLVEMFNYETGKFIPNTKSSADDFPYQESLISVKRDSAESQNPPANDERKKEADFV